MLKKEKFTKRFMRDRTYANQYYIIETFLHG